MATLIDFYYLCIYITIQWQKFLLIINLIFILNSNHGLGVCVMLIIGEDQQENDRYSLQFMLSSNIRFNELGLICSNNQSIHHQQQQQ